MENLNNRLSHIVLAIFVATAFSMCVPKACRATWFKPTDIGVVAIALPENTCIPDTSGYFLPNRPVGFALHFTTEYVVQAAIEPGVLGITDTLTHFSIWMQDTSRQWQAVTDQFYYGLPKGCDWISAAEVSGSHLRGLNGDYCRWVFSLPDNPKPQVSILKFEEAFNRIKPDHQYNSGNFPKTGLDVQSADFTFWAKPEWVKKYSNLRLLVQLETVSGKNLRRQIQLAQIPKTQPDNI